MNNKQRLEDMVQEMAKQHLNIEIQLKKRGSKQQRSRGKALLSNTMNLYLLAAIK